MPSPLDYAEDFVVLAQEKAPDGMGGSVTQWVEGEPFKCHLTLDISMEARVAEKAGVTSLFTGMVDKDLSIGFHSIFKRISDGATFRVTNEPNDNKMPSMATFQGKAFNAERYALPR